MSDPIDANYRLATGAYIATSKTGEVLDARDLYITNTGLPVPDFNLVFPKRPDYRVEKTLDKAAAYFDAKGLPYRVSVRADRADACRALLARRGFLEGKAIPGMVLAPIPEAPPLVEGLAVRRVDDARTLEDFRQTAFEGFGLPVAGAPLFLTEEFLALPNAALFVGYAADEPASTAALVCTEDVAGIYWVATRERFRGRGYGEALTWQAVAAGRDAGCPVASLQASELGRPVYARMGFVHDRDYVHFEAPEGAGS